MFYSLGGIFAKLAAQEDFLSFKFLVFYGLEIVILGIYALGWQQFIKRLPLTAAYANKATGVIWGCIWGGLFFHERMSFGKIIGILLVISGIILFAFSDRDKEISDGH